ncbi:MAG: RsmD family RNA methyltransferase, partial [Acidimicrobiales bacterium]|nr:RsmD family RNA methyltransferase [Acidimicrobiales bacterium]
RAVFVESSRTHAALVEANLEACGFSDRAEVVVADARTWLATNPGPGDLALLDPPYAFDDWSALLAGLDAGLVVVESDRGFGQVLGWHVERVRRYAGTVVTLLSPEDGDPGSSPP